MMNYKKSLMSLAAVVALAGTSLSANYIPLNNSATGTPWVLFGVTGLKTTGAGSGSTAGVFSITDNTANTKTDAGSDELFTEGFLASTGESLAKIKAISVATLEVRVDTTSLTYNEQEPVHTMYVTMEAGASPAFAITYRSSMEGKAMQYSIIADGSNAHTIVLNSASTYSNPGVGAVIETVEGLEGSTLSKMVDAVDYNLKTNPTTSSYYDKTTDQQTAATDEYVRLYTYDTADTRWDLYDSRNSEATNDFLELTKGKGYWGQMNLETTDRQAGLVLGSSSISADEYATAGISEGWNLLSFSDETSTIRKASTGLRVVLKNAAGKIKIWDSSGNHFIEAAAQGSTATLVRASCLAINQAIKQAKIDGSMPETFDLKAFPGDDATDLEMILISNQRFVIAETTADSIGVVTTLAGKIPYTVDPADLTQTDDTAAQDLDHADATDGAMSKYGEYAVIINPLVGVGTADATGVVKIHLQNAADDAVDAVPIELATDVATAATALTLTTGGADYVSTGLDVDYDTAGDADKILIASTKPFFIRDHTFTRVFDYTNVAAASSVRVTGTGLDLETSVDGSDALTDTVEEYAAVIDLAANNLDAINIGTGTSGKIVFHTSETDASKFDITENIETAPHTDQLADGTTTSDLAKGAVKGVWSLDSLATGTMNSVTTALQLSGVDQPLATDTMQITLTNSYGVTVQNAIYTLTVADGVDVGTVADRIVLETQALMTANNLSGTVVAVANALNMDIVVTSTEITNILINHNVEANPVVATESGILITPTADLVADLKFNAVYTPNYVSFGPLYTIMDAGYALKALVTGTTDLSDGTVEWESIDLTRKPSEWLDSQDYSLFKTKETSGYWAYLEAATEETLSIVNASFSPNYVTHFNENGTTYNNVSGQISLEIGGLPQFGDSDYDNSAVVKALVNGNAIELTSKSTNNVYSGDLSSYEVANLSAGSDYPVKANMANGLGSNLLNTDTGLTVDLTKPSKPTINIGDGVSVEFTSTSEDVAGYYVFDGEVPDYNTISGSNLKATLSVADAAAYPLCSKLDKLVLATDPAYTLNVFAVDGTGTVGNGNASDVATKNYIPMLKDAVRVSDTANTDSDPTRYGTIYGLDCVETGAQTIDYGFAVTSETDLQTVTVAYEPENGADLANPIDVFVRGAVSVARITYSDVYVGSVVYIEIEGVVYSYTLPTEAIATASYSAATPANLTNSGVATKRADQNL